MGIAGLRRIGPLPTIREEVERALADGLDCERVCGQAPCRGEACNSTFGQRRQTMPEQRLTTPTLYRQSPQTSAPLTRVLTVSYPGSVAGNSSGGLSRFQQRRTWQRFAA